jgi:ribosome-binding protein aMBF1 (putative translation factor)
MVNGADDRSLGKRDWRSSSRRESDARRDLDPAVADMLKRARRRVGWSVREAAEVLNIVASYVSLLENAHRVPSTVVAERLIAGYRLDMADADSLREVALEGVGKDWSPKRSWNSRRVDRPGSTLHRDGWSGRAR